MFALEGVRLIDFGQYLAGPFGPMIIGDLGADVIKVEPVTGDGMRMANAPYFGCQRGKKDIALDIKSPDGIEIAYDLVRSADIVHQNMTKGTATRLKLDYATLKELKPGLVYCNTYAYGLEGPLSHFGGLDPLYQASGGLEYEAGGVQHGNEPLYYRFGMTDAANAMLSAVGCLMALFHQRRTGEGQELWTSLMDGGLVFSSDAMLVDGEPVPRPRIDKDQMGIDALYRLYRTQDDEWIQIAAVKDSEWLALAGVLGLGDLATEARFATATSRHEQRAELDALLEPIFLTRTARNWALAFDDAGVPSEIPLETRDGETVLFDADNVELGLVAEYEHPIRGLMRQFGNLIDFSDTPGNIGGPTPLVGQHTREILLSLGRTDADVDDLLARNVVYEPDENYVERFTY
jgi:crotonobetainyl-CoA:carnitine CoA-transferase CaiB-like acyl-CoA transferase